MTLAAATAKQHHLGFAAIDAPGYNAKAISGETESNLAPRFSSMGIKRVRHVHLQSGLRNRSKKPVSIQQIDRASLPAGEVLAGPLFRPEMG